MLVKNRQCLSMARKSPLKCPHLTEDLAGALPRLRLLIGLSTMMPVKRISVRTRQIWDGTVVHRFGCTACELSTWTIPFASVDEDWRSIELPLLGVGHRELAMYCSTAAELDTSHASGNGTRDVHLVLRVVSRSESAVSVALGLLLRRIRHTGSQIETITDEARACTVFRIDHGVRFTIWRSFWDG